MAKRVERITVKFVSDKPQIMTTIQLIKDCAFFGGSMPNDRLQECREFFDNVIEKQLQEPILLSCKGRCDHGYNDELGNELFCSTK